MNKQAQREKLINEELKTIGEIESLQHDIDLYNGDLEKIRKHRADLDNGLNDQAWESYAKEVLQA